MNTATVSCNVRFTRRCSDVDIEPKMWEKDGRYHELYMSKKEIPLIIGDCSVRVEFDGLYPSLIINNEVVDIEQYLVDDDTMRVDEIVSTDGIYTILFVRYSDSMARLDMTHRDGESEVKWVAIKITNK